MAINYGQTPFIMSTYGNGTPYYIRNNTSITNRMFSRFIFAQTNMTYPGETFTDQYGFRLLINGNWTGGNINIFFNGVNVDQEFLDTEFNSWQALRLQFLDIPGVTFVSPNEDTAYPSLYFMKYWACSNTLDFPWFEIDLSNADGDIAGGSSQWFISDNNSEFVVQPLYPGREFGGDWYDVLACFEYNSLPPQYSKRTNYAYMQPPPN